MAVACWRTASRKTSVLRRKRAPRKRVRHDKGTARQARRAQVFLEQEGSTVAHGPAGHDRGMKMVAPAPRRHQPADGRGYFQTRLRREGGQRPSQLQRRFHPHGFWRRPARAAAPAPQSPCERGRAARHGAPAAAVRDRLWSLPRCRCGEQVDPLVLRFTADDVVAMTAD
jgi:hypothetical protein